MGISLLEVYIRVRKPVIWVCERAQRAEQMNGFIKSRKRSIFVIDFYLKDSAFTAVKRDATCLNKVSQGRTISQ